MEEKAQPVPGGVAAQGSRRQNHRPTLPPWPCCRGRCHTRPPAVRPGNNRLIIQQATSSHSPPWPWSCARGHRTGRGARGRGYVCL